MSLTVTASHTIILSNDHSAHLSAEDVVVTVIRLPLWGMPYAEGQATIIAPAAGEHRYLVRFAGDPVVRERFIHPDWQDDPERALRLLQQLWRTEVGPDIADFFPEDIS